ncbi:MAG: hypothetical protein ACRD32_01840 [Nitrososphaerales archaeon]|jgi:hypothetical protein
MSQLEHYKRTKQLRILALTQWTMDNNISNFTRIAEEAQKRFNVSRSTANSYANEVVKRLDKLKIQTFYCSI